MKYFVFLILMALAPIYSASGDSGVETIEIRKNLRMLVSPKGGNVIASIGEDGVLIIDDQLDGRSQLIHDALKKLSDKRVSFVFNTHYHFDHTGGNEFFGQLDARILAHRNVRKRLNSKQYIAYFKREMKPLSTTGLPVITFSDQISVYFNGDQIEFLHAPNAHTDGDAVAYFTKANVIATGDIVFNNMYPFIDVKHGGSIRGTLATIDRLIDLANENTIFAPGHGPLMTVGELSKYHRTLETIVKRIQQAIDANKTLAQVVSLKLTKEFDQVMGGGIVGADAFVAIVFESLKN